MLIRPAVLTELNNCLALDADSQTDRVWQMEQRHESHDNIVVRFQPVRLPRVMHVSYPRQHDDLQAGWEKGALILVATDRPVTVSAEQTALPEEPEEPAQIFGYCQLEAQPWQQTLWIAHLIVHRPARRQGIGTALFKTSMAWGRSQKLRRVMVAVQTKNYPAISFFQKHNLTFCGFNDHYFANRDIALFFTVKL